MCNLFDWQNSKLALVRGPSRSLGPLFLFPLFSFLLSWTFLCVTRLRLLSTLRIALCTPIALKQGFSSLTHDACILFGKCSNCYSMYEAPLGDLWLIWPSHSQEMVKVLSGMWKVEMRTRAQGAKSKQKDLGKSQPVFTVQRLMCASVISFRLQI